MPKSHLSSLSILCKSLYFQCNKFNFRTDVQFSFWIIISGCAHAQNEQKISKTPHQIMRLVVHSQQTDIRECNTIIIIMPLPSAC
jgi:hypothetical protein